MLWVGFILSLVIILLISRKNLPLGLICGAIVLGLFTNPFSGVIEQIRLTVFDPAILILAVAMGLIPLLGGAMKQSGQIDDLINNVRFSRRYVLPFSAALMGLLPMPGGALLSAPIVDQAGEGVSGELKALINVWYRHLFILIYPLEPALIVATRMSDLDIYVAILYIVPFAILAALLGYWFFLRRVTGTPKFVGKFSLQKLMGPLLIVTVAPILDFSLKKGLGLGAVATLIGVVTAISLSLVFSKTRLALKPLILKAKPWNFSLIIIGMFLYQHIFEQTNAGVAIAMLPLPILPLSVTAGFLLGLFTGRVQLPASIIIPIYLGSGNLITPGIFALLYVGIYFGYIMSPAHPCVVVTCEFFKTSMRRLITGLLWATMIIFALVLGLSYLL